MGPASAMKGSAMSDVFTASVNKRASVLVYTSSAARVPDRKRASTRAGTWLPELTLPLAPLFDAGYGFDFATPDGRPCAIDERSKMLVHWRFSRRRLDSALAFLERLNERGFKGPMKISDVLADHARLDAYDALFLPGGHAPMTDVLHTNWIAGNELNEETGALLRHFHDAGKPTALICHAPAVLAAAPSVHGKWIYDGYNMTCVSMFTDHLTDFLTGARPVDYATRILERLGGKVRSVRLGKSFVVEDRELITAQDPFGGEELGAKLLKKIARYLEERAAKASSNSLVQGRARTHTG
jgi:putative intracellular protease/amidase